MGSTVLFKSKIVVLPSTTVSIQGKRKKNGSMTC
jgi:hypothetical protein